jgi:hypothetical protein
MPRFHFHVRTHVEAFDEEGVEMTDLAEAQRFALKDARHLMSNEIRDTGRTSLSHSIVITSGEGELLHVTRYSDAVALHP